MCLYVNRGHGVYADYCVIEQSLIPVLPSIDRMTPFPPFSLMTAVSIPLGTRLAAWGIELRLYPTRLSAASIAPLICKDSLS